MATTGKILFDSFIPRTKFILNQNPNWFPGHMTKGIREIGKVLKRTDCILEVHDARIPFSGRNLSMVKRMSSNKPVILILNKADLLNRQFRPQIKTSLLKEMKQNEINAQEIVFLDSISGNTKASGYDEQFLSTVINAIENPNNPMDQVDYLNAEQNYNLLVVGIPNTGKSTVINRLRNVYLNKGGKATKTGDKAGVTKSVMEKIKVCDYPKKIYLFDSPGILEPHFNRFRNHQDQEIFMRCALCGTLNDNVIGKELIADYLLYWLNKHNQFEYVDFLGMPKPSNDIIEALTYGSIKYGCFRKFKNLNTGKLEQVPDYVNLADKFISAFRKGHFGKFLLDLDFLSIVE